MTAPTILNRLPAYEQLREHAHRLKSASIEHMLQSDANRAENFTLEAAGLHLDFSKHLVDASALASLYKLADEAVLGKRIKALLSGEQVNSTEGRAALHTLLRASSDNGMPEKYAEVVAAREKVRDLADALNQQEQTGFSGTAITDVVNIGIGGSDLGPRLVTEALQPFHGSVRCHYVANVDPADLQNTLTGLAQQSTLFIICSKTFRTEETLANSLAAREWMLAGGATATDLDKHFVAVTTNLQAASDFGICENNCFPMWDWVGGRYSVWSAVGLSCAIAVGWNHFDAFLGGAESMDQHFSDSEPSANLPILMALLEIWYCNFFDAGNHAVLPYDHSLGKFPDLLQQLTMESNGKRVSTDGSSLGYNTAPVLWGAAGTMGQHSFHQLLHQGTELCPTDFILPLTTHTGLVEQHKKLVANGLAQSRTMMVGRSLEDSEASLKNRGMSAEEAASLAPHLAMPGNRPNSVISMVSLNPATLGALIALYEHRTFCSGQLWGINPFDQWGVERGKEIGVEVLQRLEGSDSVPIMDAATERLIKAGENAQQ
jgi:glucose-6-phosphate isomerase